MTDFPDVSEREVLKFRLLRQMVSDDPAVLDRPDCPYDEKTKAWARMAFAPPALVVSGLLAGLGDEVEDGSAEDWGDIARKSRALYKELEDLVGPDSRLDTQEKINTVKVRAQLLDRLVTIGERAVNLRAMAEFMAETIRLLEEAVPDARTDFIEKLRALAAN